MAGKSADENAGGPVRRAAAARKQKEDLAKVQNGAYTVTPAGEVWETDKGPNANQAFAEQYNNYQDPDSMNPVIDPNSASTPGQQYGDLAVTANRRLAQKSLQEVKDIPLDAYTLNPTFYQPMSWDPSGAYQYETAEQQGRTAEEGLDAQRAALGGYNDIYNQGGLTAIDRAAMMESQMMREQQLRGNREAIMSNAAEQGRGSGVMSFLSQQQAAQGTANMRALDEARIQAAALGRKDAALAGMGMVGNQMQTAQDAIDKFNTGARQDVQMRNAAQKNAGIDTKYQDEQTVSRGNTELANSFEVQNKGTNFGIRGRMRDIQDARGDVANANLNVANHAEGIDQKVEQKKQTRDANIWNGVGLATGVGTQIIKKAWGQ